MSSNSINLDRDQRLVHSAWPEWQLMEWIGAGQYGDVYKARKRGFAGDSFAAIKVVTIENTDRDSGLDIEQTDSYLASIAQNYAREIKMMESVKGYSNIVNIEDYHVIKNNGGNPWHVLIRMELLMPLHEYLETREITDETIIRIGTDLCRALEVCGTKSIVHRDIKPANVFANNDGVIKLGDFGVARQILDYTSQTRTGSPGFMAPEVYHGSLRATDFERAQRADIYSLGMLLYWCANKRRMPFEKLTGLMTADDIRDAFERKMSGEQVPDPANASDGLKKVILKACSYDASERYMSAGEFREALEGITAEKLDEKRKEQKQRKTSIWLVAFLALLIIVIGFIGYPTIRERLEKIRGADPEAHSVEQTNTTSNSMYLGHYEQDGNLTNGKEAIEWMVLDVDHERNRALLISKEALDSVQYYDEYEDVTWENSGLREWLNSTFFKKAFTLEEQQRIITSSVGYVPTSANEELLDAETEEMYTQDKVFLLSYKEAFDLYFTSDSARMCSATSYAINKEDGVWLSGSEEYPGNCVWLLRGTGSNIAAVDVNGSATGFRVDQQGAGIRPAVWISLSDDISVGDTLALGTFHDHPVKWQVLGLNGNNALLITTDILCSLPYNTVFSRLLTWENCSLRKWLNQEFYDEAFNSEQQSLIQLTHVDNSSAQQRDIYGTIDGQPDTDDHIFLLSWKEVCKYFPTEDSRKGQTGSWWTRSCGEDPGTVLSISYNGRMGYGANAPESEIGVRPVMWFSLDDKAAYTIQRIKTDTALDPDALTDLFKDYDSEISSSVLSPFPGEYPVGLDVAIEHFTNQAASLVQSAKTWNENTVPHTLDEFPLSSRANDVYDQISQCYSIIMPYGNSCIWKTNILELLNNNTPESFDMTLDFDIDDGYGRIAPSQIGPDMFSFQLPDNLTLKDFNGIGVSCYWYLPDGWAEILQIQYTIDHGSITDNLFVGILFSQDEGCSIEWYPTSDTIRIGISSVKGNEVVRIRTIRYDTESGQILAMYNENQQIDFSSMTSPEPELMEEPDEEDASAWTDNAEWSDWTDRTRTRKTITDPGTMKERVVYHWWAARCRSCGTHNPYWGSNIKCIYCGEKLSKENVEHINIYPTEEYQQKQVNGRNDGATIDGLNYWYCEVQYEYSYLK